MNSFFYPFFFSFLLFSHSFVPATQVEPWLGNPYEFELRTTAIYRNYSLLSCGSHYRERSSDDVFLNISLCNSIPDPACGVEIEFRDASTRKHRGGGLDQWKLTGRCVLMDDILGDFFSLAAGISYAQAFRHSLRDVSCFHHGLNNGEVFLSIGKESSEEMIWGSRWWTLAAFGIAERGSPWIRANFDWERRLQENQEAAVFIHSLVGLGRRNLHPFHFRGYGAIQHQSVDLGVRYRFLIDYYGSATIEYSYRIFARNFPACSHTVFAQILYTFGL